MAIKLFNSVHGFSVGVSQDNIIDATGNIVANNLLVNGDTDLGNISNVTIDGGSNGQALTTDGNGNLSWTTFNTTNTISNGNSNVSVSANSNVNISVNGVSNVVTISDVSLSTNGNLSLNGNVSSSSYVDVTDTIASYSNNSTVNFPNFSGMVLVNDTSDGRVDLWLCGGGFTSLIGSSTTSLTQAGNITHNSNISGYTWTNDTGNTISASFAKIKTRNNS
jgi:hypothetical protein